VIGRLLGTGVTLLLGGLAAASLLLFTGLDRALVLDAFLVFAGAVVLLALARATGAATRSGGRSAFDAALRHAQPAEGRPERLRRLEGQVYLATTTASDFYFGLRPQLRDAAAHRLRTRLGIELDAQPERAARALGSEAWALLRPDRGPPEERFGPGVPAPALRRVVDAIERIST
jgi:hypothetical protein